MQGRKKKKKKKGKKKIYKVNREYEPELEVMPHCINLKKNLWAQVSASTSLFFFFEDNFLKILLSQEADFFGVFFLFSSRNFWLF